MTLIDRIRTAPILHRTIELSRFAQILFGSMILLLGLSWLGNQQTITSIDLVSRSLAPSLWFFSLGGFGLAGLAWTTSRSRRILQRLRRENAELKRELEKRQQEIQETKLSVVQVRERLDRDIRPQLVRLDGLAWLLAQDHGDRLPAEGKVLLHRLRERTRSMGSTMDGIGLPSPTKATSPKR